MMQLTTRQGEIVEADCDLLVLGGPGSGKTTVGLLKAQARIARGMQRFQQVLFLSFSRSAVHQIMKAAGVRLGCEERRLLSVQTFHSFCWHVLRSHGCLLGLRAPLKVLSPEDEAALSAGLSKQQWVERKAKLQAEGVIVFDSFAPLVVDLFRRCDRLRCLFSSCYPLVVVDEFQDTNDAEWALVDCLSREGQLVCLADPHQRIYDFRPGVSPRRIEMYRESRGAKVFDLSGMNHRSAKSDLMSFAQAVLNAKNPVCARSSSVVIERYRYSNECVPLLKRVIKRVTKTVVERRGSGPVDIAVFASTNTVVKMLSEWLWRPTKTAKWTQDHDVLLDLHPLAHAWRAIAGLLSAGTGSLRETAGTILEDMANAYRCRHNRGDLEKANQLSAAANEVRMQDAQVSFPTMASLIQLLTVLADGRWTGSPRKDVERVMSEMKATGEVHLNQLLDFCSNHGRPCCFDTLERALAGEWAETKSYAKARELCIRVQGQERLRETFRPHKGIVLMTLHRCKGMEYDSVVIFDDIHQPGRLVLTDDHPPYERSRRLLYMAIARARFFATIITPLSPPSEILP